MPKKDTCLKNLNLSRKDNSTQYVFLDSQIARNLDHERNVSGEFHRMMRCQRVTDENFETGFVKRFTQNNQKALSKVQESSLSMVVDVDSSEYSSDNSISQVPTFDTSVGNGISVINVTFDSCSETLTSKTDIKEYVRYGNYLRKKYLSQSYDDLLFKFGKVSHLDERYLTKNNRGFSEEDLKSFLDRKKYESSDEQTLKYSGNFSKHSFIRRNKKKRKKFLNNKFKSKQTNLILVENVDSVKMCLKSDKKPRKLSIFRRMVKYLERFIGWKCVDHKENVSIQTDDDLSRTIETSYLETENVTTIYQVSISKNDISNEECSTSRVTNILNNNQYMNKDKRILVSSRHFYAASLSYPFRKWFRMKSREAYSTGELLKEPYRTRNTKIDPKFIELPDKKKLIDISRAYYPLTKWTLINRFFRQKNSSEKSPDQNRIGKGDTPTKSVDGSVREGTDGAGRRTEVIPVSMSDVIIEEAVKTNGEKLVVSELSPEDASRGDEISQIE